MKVLGVAVFFLSISVAQVSYADNNLLNQIQIKEFINNFNQPNIYRKSVREVVACVKANKGNNIFTDYISLYKHCKELSDRTEYIENDNEQ